MKMTELVEAFGRMPKPWSEGRTIPWDDPAFSSRMLGAHLSQDHDRASRREELIDAHVKFIEQVALPRNPARILDLACGPGLYCLRLARHGHECVGVDFSPSSIEYARLMAEEQGLVSQFELGDIRMTNAGKDFDLVMLLYGELNLFPPHEIHELLHRCRNALRPGGLLILEVHSFEAVQNLGTATLNWSAHDSGLFSDRPHLRLGESFWQEKDSYALGRHWVVDAATAEVSMYGWTMKAYTDSEYVDLLQDAGLKVTGQYESLTGQTDGKGFPVLLAAPA